MTKNFSLIEFFVSGQHPAIAEELWDNREVYIDDALNLLAIYIMQPVRDFIKVPVKITSGYRDIVLNGLVAQTAHSLHMDGLACDFTVTDRILLPKIYEFIRNFLDYGELILYKENGLWRNIHVSLHKFGYKRITEIKEV